MPHHSTISDQDLVGLAATGCQDAIRELINRYQGKIMSFLSKRGNAHSENEDILQETFISAFEKLDTFDASRPFSAWIFGIARNKANSHYRKIVRLNDAPSDEEHVDPASPSTRLDQREQSQLFWDESKRLLNEDQFTAMWLKYQEGHSIMEIARTLDKSESNIKIYLFRARKALANSSLLADQRLTSQPATH